MCAKKYLMDTIHSNNLKSEYDKLISIFEECKIEYIPLDYFIMISQKVRKKIKIIHKGSQTFQVYFSGKLQKIT